MKAIQVGAALALAAALALGIWLHVRSKIYDAGENAKILYTDSDGT